MRSSWTLTLLLILALTALSMVGCASVSGSSSVLSVEREALTEGVVLNLPASSDSGDVLARLVYTRKSRTDLGHNSWSYSVRYRTPEEEYQLSIKTGPDQASVYEAARVHNANGPFTISIESIEESGAVPPDVVLSLQWTTSGQSAVGAQGQPTNVSVSSNGEVSWTPGVGAEAHEVQWAFVDADNDTTGTSQVFQTHPTGIIEVQKPTAHLSFAYQAGVVYVRVRALGRFEDSETVRKGPWSDTTTYSIAANAKLDEGRNWTRSTSFDNTGTNRTIVTHYDSVLRQRQQVAASLPNGITRVSETVLDDEGRAALTTMPIPVGIGSLSYRPDFVSSTNHSFSSEDVRSELPPVLAPSGAGAHFRTGHGHIGVPEEGRPYTTTVFARDAEGRPRSSSGVGTALHLSPSRFLYGTAGAEFKQLFGAGSGVAGNYARDIYQDPNGQGHVQYWDPDGRLIADGLVGGTPSSLSPLPENPLASGSAETIRTHIAIPQATLDPLRPVDEYTYTLVNAVPRTKYSLEYALSSATSSVQLTNGDWVCPSCKYHVSITIYRQNGQIVECEGPDSTDCIQVQPGGSPESIAQYSSEIPPPNTSECGNGGTLELDVTLNDLGEYKVVRRLELDTSVIDTYVEENSSLIPGVPDQEQLASQTASYGYTECELQNCQGGECEAMLSESVARQCDALEAVARADMIAQAAQGLVDDATAASYLCPTAPGGVDGESAACCHVRQCRHEVRQLVAIDTLLWQREFARATDWDSANEAGLLDPLLAGINRPPGIQPCVGRLCLDHEGHVAARAQILTRMRSYWFDRRNFRMINLWDYVRRPELGLNSETQWLFFRGAYRTLRSEALVAAQNASSCPYNDIVPAPDLTMLNANAELQEQAATEGLTEHCLTQCSANVCNWRWQLSDQCPAYNPFDFDGDGQVDFPAYLCDADTPTDAVQNHLSNYCLRKCGLQNPYGSISIADLATDPDLIAAQEAAHCDLSDIAGGLFESSIVCLEDCDYGRELTACGQLARYQLTNWRQHRENPEDFFATLSRLTAACPHADSVTVEQDSVLLGDLCRLWVVDVRGNPISLTDLGTKATTDNSVPDSLDVPRRKFFTGLVVTMRNGSPAYVMSNCQNLLTEYKGPCCEDGAMTPTPAPKQPITGWEGFTGSEAEEDTGLFSCAEGDMSAARVEASDACSQEMLLALQEYLAPTGTIVSTANSCVGSMQYQSSLLQTKNFDGKYCWFDLLAGEDAQPWSVNDGWKHIATDLVALPFGYPSITTHTVGGSEIVLSYTGIAITIENDGGKVETIYVYGNCALLVGPKCTPIDGEYTLNIPPYDFDDWEDQCSEDAAEFQESQTNRMFREGQDSALASFRNEMTANCMGGAVSETLSLEYKVAEYAHTLYYYDQVGNVTAIVAPKGVRAIPLADGTFDELAMPDHQMVTRQRYDSRNNAVSRSSPDGGEAKFVYDSRGRQRFSQTSEQASRQDWSYVKYDKLDRIVETGVIGPFGEGQIAANADSDAFPAGASRREVVKATYGPTLTENPATQAEREEYRREIARYLRGRVSMIEADESAVELAFGYSPSGQVEQLKTKHLGSPTDQSGLSEKTAWYSHDPVDDVLLSIDYQVAAEPAPRHMDEFRQKFEYDDERRLMVASSSTDGIIWERDARYSYYAHGPIMRYTIGEDEVQGVDYVHTIQGWIKAINAGDGSADRDPGEDGKAGALNYAVPQDVIGVLFGYFDGDFAPTTAPFLNGDTQTGDVFSLFGESSLYTGVIRSRVLAHRGLPGTPRLHRSTYEYDQLTRLTGNSTVTPEPDQSPFATAYSYDLNGNLLTLSRTGGTAGNCAGIIDDLSFSYQADNNSLLHLNDEIMTSACDVDLDDQGALDANDSLSANYSYDEVGRLVSDRANQIKKISWSATDKALTIERVTAPTPIAFAYDGFDQRARKLTPDAATYYVRHPDGRILATYERQSVAAVDDMPSVKAFMIYAGEHHLGVRLPAAENADSQLERVRGLTRYQIADQVGSVLAVLSDQKIGDDADGDGLVDTYVASIISAADYYPFGMLKPGQDHLADEYRFAYGGYEKDDEIQGLGSVYGAGARFYDPRTTRWWAVDPLFDGTSSPYSYALNNPIQFNDPKGLQRAYVQGEPGDPVMSQRELFEEAKRRSQIPLPRNKEEAHAAIGVTGGLQIASLLYAAHSGILSIAELFGLAPENVTEPELVDEQKKKVDKQKKRFGDVESPDGERELTNEEAKFINQYKKQLEQEYKDQGYSDQEADRAARRDANRMAERIRRNEDEVKIEPPPTKRGAWPEENLPPDSLKNRRRGKGKEKW